VIIGINLARSFASAMKMRAWESGSPVIAHHCSRNFERLWDGTLSCVAGFLLLLQLRHQQAQALIPKWQKHPADARG